MMFLNMFYIMGEEIGVRSKGKGAKLMMKLQN